MFCDNLCKYRRVIIHCMNLIVEIMILFIVIVNLLNFTVVKILWHVSLQRNLEDQKHAELET